MKFQHAYKKFKEDCSKGKLMHLCYGTEDDLIQKWFDKMIVPYLEAEERKLFCPNCQRNINKRKKK